jgi:hypothetical protein
MIGERAEKSEVPLDFVFTSSQGNLAVPSSLDFDEKTVQSVKVDFNGDVCDAVEQDGVYAPPAGDSGGDADGSDTSSSEEGSDSEEDEYSDDEDSEDEDEIDVDVM